MRLIKLLLAWVVLVGVGGLGVIGAAMSLYKDFRECPEGVILAMLILLLLVWSVMTIARAEEA